MITDPFLASALPWIVVYRILNAFLVQTWLQPDEYWQSLEVAHEMVFGYGHKTWEWQPEHQIRGYLHPLLFAGVYQVLKVTGLDSRILVAIAPRLLQVVFVVVGDVYIYKFARRQFGPTAAQYALFATLINWAMFLCMVRTFSNTLETSLTAMVLAYWPFRNEWNQKKTDDDHTMSFNEMISMRRKAIIVMALTFLLRPTSGMAWVFLGFHHLWLLARSSCAFPFRAMVNFALEVIVIVGIACVVGVLIDRVCSGNWVFVPYNFLKFNVLIGGSNVFGEHPWTYYFISFPYMLLSLVPAFISGLRQSFGVPAVLMIFVFIIFTFTPHKESRFLLPIFPTALCYCGKGLVSFCSSTWSKRGMLGFIIITNLIVSAYYSLYLGSGPLDVVYWLLKQPDLKSVTVLQPCHSTPHYSMFHLPEPIPLDFLDCSPSPEPDRPSQLTMNYTETKDFFRDPLRFVSEYFEFPETPKQLEPNCEDCSQLKYNNCTKNRCCAWYGTSCGLLGAKPLPIQWKGPSGKLHSLPLTNLTHWGANWRRSKLLSLPSHVVLDEKHAVALHPFFVHGGYKFAVRFEQGIRGPMEVWRQ